MGAQAFEPGLKRRPRLVAVSSGGEADVSFPFLSQPLARGLTALQRMRHSARIARAFRIGALLSQLFAALLFPLAPLKPIMLQGTKSACNRQQERR
jgi:hypothetical protein